MRAARAARAVGALVAALVATLAGLLVLAFCWGLVEPRLLDVEEIVAQVPGLPESWAGRRVAVIADLQLGLWWDNEGTAARAVERAVATRPAAVLLLGDYVYHAAAAGEEVERLERVLRPLSAGGVPVFAVLGNHDYGLRRRDGRRADAARASRIRETLRALGIRILHNEAATLRSARGEALHVVGIGSEWAGEARPAEAFDAVAATAPRIVIMHNPVTFRAIAAGRAPVAFAGHTHGGQVRLPGLPSWTWLEWVHPHHPPVDGWVAAAYGAPGNRLYVSRGIGMSRVPVRIHCPPELTLVTLRRASAGP